MVNTEQITLWNERSGPRWVALQPLLDAQLAPFGQAALARLPLAAGMRVLDVGCGCGDSTLALADAVGPQGLVVGVDVSAPMLARARERARDRLELRFVEADAQTHPFDERFDALFSRFGVMFFDDPVGAFTHLHTALVAGAPVAFVTWRKAEQNPWMTVPLAAVAPLLDAPPVLSPPGTPGPFGFADDAHVRAILTKAGFCDVMADPLDLPMQVGGGPLDDAVEVSLQVGPCGQIARENPHLVPRIREALREALAPHLHDGVVTLDAAAWIFTARARGATPPR
jgi:SAM-dependent methyltransferase